jgi:hypothetical protein
MSVPACHSERRDGFAVRNHPEVEESLRGLGILRLNASAATVTGILRLRFRPLAAQENFAQDDKLRVRKEDATSLDYV